MGQRNSCARALAIISLSLALARTGEAAPEKPTPKADVGKQIEALAQTQAALQQQLTELREAVNKLGDRLQGSAEGFVELRESVGDLGKTDKTSHEEIVELSKGLYVEVSGVKGDVSLVRSDLQALAASIESSRFGSGILIAAVIALQIILVLLAIRRRG